MQVFEVESGEVIAQFEKFAAERGIRDAAIVSLIGGIRRFSISTMPATDESADIVSTYDLPAEMHGNGEIRDGRVHIHATMAIQGDHAVAGHLHSAEVEHWFARAYVVPVSA